MEINNIAKTLGSLGGRATLKKYGKKHFQDIRNGVYKSKRINKQAPLTSGRNDANL